MTKDRANSKTPDSSLTLWALAFLVVMILCSNQGAPGKEAALPQPSESLKLVRQRYLDLMRYTNVDWEDPEVIETIKRLEFDTGDLLQQQVADPASPWRGCFQKPEQQTPGGEPILMAREKIEKAIHVLCSVYWCKKSRFYKSSRVLRSIEIAYGFLNTEQDRREAKSVYDMVPPYRHTPDNLCRWLAQVGEFLPTAVRADMKDRLRTILVRTKTADMTLSLHRLIGSACLEDDRLLPSVKQNIADLAERNVAKDGSVLGPRGEISIEDAARRFCDIARYQYLAMDTELALPQDLTAEAERLLSKFLSWTIYRGRADLLAFRSPYKWTGEVERQVAIGAAHLAAVTPEQASRWPLAYGELLRQAFDPRQRSYYLLDFYPLITGGQIGLAATPEPRAKYFDDGGYLTVHRPNFFASLRFPLRKGHTAEYSRLAGVMNLRSAPNDPNLLYPMPQFEPLLPGCTFSQFVARKKDYYVVEENSEVACADAAVLDGSSAVAGVRMVIKRGNNVLRANKSWTFLEDKIIVAGSGIEAKSQEIRNKAWAASPTDHRASITFSFPKPEEIDFARIYFRVYEGQLFCVPRTIYVLISQDGILWTRIREVRNDQLPRSGDLLLGGMTYRLRKSKAKLFRLFFPEDADGFTTQIAEVELFNIGAAHDDDPIPAEAENLVRKAQVFVSSSFTADNGPERVNDGQWMPALEPALTRTCIAFLRTGTSEFVFLGPKGILKMPFPGFDKEQAISDVRWCHIKQTAFFFLQPEDLILKGMEQGYGRICIDHTKRNSFAVVCFPDLDLEQTARAAEAGLVKSVRLDESAHIFVDEASGITSASFFDIVKGDEISSEGPAYVIYRKQPELLATAKSRRAAPSTVWINAPGTTALVVNGSLQSVYKNGPMVRILAHR